MPSLSNADGHFDDKVFRKVAKMANLMAFSSFLLSLQKSITKNTENTSVWQKTFRKYKAIMENAENNLGIQKKLFHEIQKNIPKHRTLVDIISEVLHIGSDAAYNRIRCDKLLNIEEASTLCKHFRIPFDLSTGAGSMSHFDCTYRPIDLSMPGEYLNYMFALSGNIEKLRAAGDSEMLMSATDIPVFHLLSQKELTLFKLYTWTHSIYDYKDSLEDFMREVETPELLNCYQKIKREYELTPSTEIWTANTINTTLMLINYYLDIYVFPNKDLPLLLCRQVLNILDKLEKWAENGSKGESKTPLQLFVSEMELENTYVLMRHSGRTNCLVKLFTINSLNISDAEFCRETERWLIKLAKRSIPLCGGSEKERIKFFNTQRERVRYLIEKISGSF